MQQYERSHPFGCNTSDHRRHENSWSRQRNTRARNGQPTNGFHTNWSKSTFFTTVLTSVLAPKRKAWERYSLSTTHPSAAQRMVLKAQCLMNGRGSNPKTICKRDGKKPAEMAVETVENSKPPCSCTRANDSKPGLVA